jgi:hypothetical protein
MKAIAPKQPLFVIIAMLAVLALSSLACAIGGVTLDRNAALVDITLNENEINQFLNRIVVRPDYSQDRLLEKVSSVEMHDGFIRVFGSATQSVRNSNGDVQYKEASVKDGVLKMKVQVNFK